MDKMSRENESTASIGELYQKYGKQMTEHCADLLVHQGLSQQYAATVAGEIINDLFVYYIEKLAEDGSGPDINNPGIVAYLNDGMTKRTFHYLTKHHSKIENIRRIADYRYVPLSERPEETYSPESGMIEQMDLESAIEKIRNNDSGSSKRKFKRDTDMFLQYWNEGYTKAELGRMHNLSREYVNVALQGVMREALHLMSPNAQEQFKKRFQSKQEQEEQLETVRTQLDQPEIIQDSAPLRQVNLEPKPEPTGLRKLWAQIKASLR